MMTFRRRRLALARLKRAFRWEFWPMWVLYFPVVFYVLWLTIRYRGLVFTSVNPAMPGSGVIGEKKSDLLAKLQASHPEHTAYTHLVSQNLSFVEQLSLLDDFIEQHGLPIILKPDYGQRGIDVKIVRTREQGVNYLKTARHDSVMQPYIKGVEFGLFYARLPNQSTGELFSVTHKCFPHVIGDGKATVENLILNHARLHFMSSYLLKNLHPSTLLAVPRQGEEVAVVELGSHCRGSLFLDGRDYVSSAVERAVEELSQSLSGFYFGRYDVRAESIEAFSQGIFKVIEVNGVTSEPTHMYDPKYSVWYAYKMLFKQWRLAFKIGQMNQKNGCKPLTFSEFFRKLKIMNRELST